MKIYKLTSPRSRDERIDRLTQLSDENGSALVLGALLLIGMLIVSGLAIDGSNAYLQRRKMQTAADAAALAGIHRLALGFTTADVDAEVQAVAIMNGADRVEWSFTDATSIQVTTYRDVDTYLAGLVNVNRISVDARSASAYNPIRSASRLLPMTLPCSEVAGFVPGQIYQFWRDSNSTAGNFGWLDWSGGSASSLELAGHIADVSSSGERHIGEWVDGSTGVEGSSAVRSSLNGWIGESIMIPLHDSVQSTGNNLQYRLCGFVRFTVTDYDFSGSMKRVEGMFEYSTYRGSAGSTSAGNIGSWSTDDYGTFAIQLTR